jgi:hypothetical protein
MTENPRYPTAFGHSLHVEIEYNLRKGGWDICKINCRRYFYCGSAWLQIEIAKTISGGNLSHSIQTKICEKLCGIHGKNAFMVLYKLEFIID